MKIELPEKEGYEWEECTVDDWVDLPDKECARLESIGEAAFFRLVPKLKFYNWKNTDNRVLVNTGKTVERLDAAIKARGSSDDCQGWTLTDDWIPNIDGKCPFDEEAVIVEVVLCNHAGRTARNALDLRWDLSGSDTDVACSRFVKLKDNYTFGESDG